MGRRNRNNPCKHGTKYQPSETLDLRPKLPVTGDHTASLRGIEEKGDKTRGAKRRAWEMWCGHYMDSAVALTRSVTTRGRSYNGDEEGHAACRESDTG
jgi:hypothetical protein